MLTDIFADRYIDVPIWSKYTESDSRFFVKIFRLISEQVLPYYSDGKTREGAKKKWDDINKRLSMELGLKDLTPTLFMYESTWQGQKSTAPQFFPIISVCENFVCAKYDGTVPADKFIKERISFIEIAFRDREEELSRINAALPNELVKAEIESKIKPSKGIRLPGDRVEGLKAYNKVQNDLFKASCDELNIRFKQARYNLNYHNGFIQISTDDLINNEVEKPFWVLISEPKWFNVDHDMKEAINLRDTLGRDPSWYAAKALESTIKIISDEKKWTHGNEKGAISYIENLASKKNGQFIRDWEKEGLISFFREVRNPLGHGAGSDLMPALTPEQTNWAIEFCMIWVKNLICRL